MPHRGLLCCPLPRGSWNGVGFPHSQGSQGPEPHSPCPPGVWFNHQLPVAPKLEGGSGDAQPRRGATPTASETLGYKRNGQAGEFRSPHPNMTQSDRPSGPALALVLMAMLLTREWGHMPLSPTTQALLILPTTASPMPSRHRRGD